MKNGSVKQVFSQMLGRKVDVWVLETPNPKGLIYMMHGNGGDCLEWEENTDIARLAAQYGLAVVAPDFEDSYCTNTADGRPWFDYLTQELPALTEELLGRSFTPENTYIAGLSAGAYGALKWAFAKPGSFAGCISLSGVVDMAARIALLPEYRLPSFRPIFGKDLTVVPQNDLPLITKTAAQGGYKLPVFLACGTGDSFLAMNNGYDKLLTELEVPHVYHTGPGGHEWDFWAEWIGPALEWMMAQN